MYGECHSGLHYTSDQSWKILLVKIEIKKRRRKKERNKSRMNTPRMRNWIVSCRICHCSLHHSHLGPTSDSPIQFHCHTKPASSSPWGEGAGGGSGPWSQSAARREPCTSSVVPPCAGFLDHPCPSPAASHTRVSVPGCNTPSEWNNISAYKHIVGWTEGKMGGWK